MEEAGHRNWMGHQDNLLPKDFCILLMTDVIGGTCSSFLQNVSECLCQTVPWPEWAIGLARSGISYLHQACCQTLRIGRHLWQEISWD